MDYRTRFVVKPGASELSLKMTKDGLHDPTIRATTHFVRGGLGTV